MATYKGIQGYTVQKLSADPDKTEASGQLWYNSSAGKFKIGTESAAAWAASGSLNTGRSELGAAGTQSAAIAFAGEPPNTGKTESFNGSTWTEVADLNQVRYAVAGGGTSPDPTSLPHGLPA